MTIEPYFLHNLQVSPNWNNHPATLVTLHDFDTNNQAFAKRVAAQIDKIAAQQPDQWEKA